VESRKQTATKNNEGDDPGYNLSFLSPQICTQSLSARVLAPMEQLDVTDLPTLAAARNRELPNAPKGMPNMFPSLWVSSSFILFIFLSLSLFLHS
jgi:hypothetical protein